MDFFFCFFGLFVLLLLLKLKENGGIGGKK